MKVAFTFYSEFYNEQNELELACKPFLIEGWPDAILPKKGDMIENAIFTHLLDDEGKLPGEIDNGKNSQTDGLSFSVDLIYWDKIDGVILPVFDLKGE